MEKKSQDFSMDDVRRVANSPAGQQLMALLQRTDSEKMALAQQQAASGDYADASRTLRSMLTSPEVRKLMKKLGG